MYYVFAKNYPTNNSIFSDSPIMHVHTHTDIYIFIYICIYKTLSLMKYRRLSPPFNAKSAPSGCPDEDDRCNSLTTGLVNYA